MVSECCIMCCKIKNACYTFEIKRGQVSNLEEKFKNICFDYVTEIRQLSADQKGCVIFPNVCCAVLSFFSVWPKRDRK